MENKSEGTFIRRFNINRPKWFGGFFGFEHKHNTPGNCLYQTETVERIISRADLNRLVEPMYLMTPILAYHMTITVFLALSLLLTILQQGFNWLIEFAFLDIAPSNTYLHTLGILWYIVWGVGLFLAVPLYYVSLHHVERYFRDSSDPIFEQLKVKVRVKKDEPGKFVLIPGFKKIDAIEIVSA